MALLEQELHTLPDHLSASPVFSGVCASRSLALCVSFVDCYLSFCTFSFGYCVVYSFSFGYCVVSSSSIYGFWLPLWYHQTLLTRILRVFVCRYCMFLRICFRMLELFWQCVIFCFSFYSKLNISNIFPYQKRDRTDIMGIIDRMAISGFVGTVSSCVTM